MTPSSASKRCDLCDGTDFEQIGQLDRRGNPLDTVVCRHCGLVAHGQIPTEHELADFYRSDYREDYHGETTPSARRVMRAWKNGGRIYRQLADYVVPTDEVFEVGAGIGCTVKQFERRGHFAAGIEPHEGFQNYGARTLRASVTQASLFDLPPRPAHDVILLIHVIEHFRSPRAALQHLHQLVQPGGLLYVECPNLGGPFAMRDKLFHFAHIHNFTRQTLVALAQRCGFSLEKSFKPDDDPCLEMLFRKSTVTEPTYRGSYDATMAALHKHTWSSYHLRWNYLWPRVRKLASYGLEHLFAKGYVQRLLARCQQRPPSSLPARRAA